MPVFHLIIILIILRVFSKIICPTLNVFVTLVMTTSPISVTTLTLTTKTIIIISLHYTHWYQSLFDNFAPVLTFAVPTF